MLLRERMKKYEKQTQQKRRSLLPLLRPTALTQAGGVPRRLKALPALNGAKLISRQEIRQQIEKLDRENDSLTQAKAGFRHLAFGPVADAIKLIDGERGELESLDLFMVSDIKIPKGGGMEIKFFDRLKALEALATLEAVGSGESSLPFYKALESSAKLISERQDDLES